MNSKIYMIFFFFALGLISCSPSGGQIKESESLESDPIDLKSADPNKDLLGIWDNRLDFLNAAPEELSEISFHLNQFEQSTNDSSVFNGTGCMLNSDLGTTMPLSFQATYNESLSNYGVIIMSTFIDSGADFEASLIRFQASISPGSPSTVESSAEGDFTTGTTSGNWSGTRQSLEKTECIFESGMDAFFYADLYIHKITEVSPPMYGTFLDVGTTLAVSSVQVEDPDGKIISLDSYADFWTPDVDFVTEFRFLANIESEALQDRPYVFTFYDILGEPIEGAVFTDKYGGCEYGNPTNITIELILENNLPPQVHLSWDSPVILTENIEGNSYQIILHAETEQMDVYGAEGVLETTHILPWETFESGVQGFPDGSDYGVSLGSLEDGIYKITVGAWFLGNEDNGERGSNCSVYDNREDLVIEISDGNLIIPN